MSDPGFSAAKEERDEREGKLCDEELTRPQWERDVVCPECGAHPPHAATVWREFNGRPSWTCVACLVGLVGERPTWEAARPQFTALDDGRYRFVVPGVATFEADLLRREAHQLKCELAVRTDLPGARTFDGVLSIGDLNLSSTRAREGHAKYLAERAKADDVDFTGLLEEFAQRVLAAERAGAPSVLLSDLERPAPERVLAVEAVPLLPRHPMILFGDGGTLKSYLALYFAIELAKRGLRVGMADWELAGEDHRERAERLAGSDIPPIHYARCSRPLVYEAERLRRIVRDERLDYLIFDSIAFACDGPPEAAEVAGRYFQALRQLGPLGSLHVAHVAKAFEGSDQKPFGSAFWHNGARSTWNVKRGDTAPGDRAISVALHNRKANLGPLRASVCLEFRFEEERTHIQQRGLETVPELAAGLTVRQRMGLALKAGPMTIEALAQEIEEKTETVRRTVSRYKGKNFNVLNGGRVALLESRR